MQIPLQISFRGMQRSEEIVALIEERSERLEQFADHVMSCRVVVEPAGKHHREGNHYRVRLDVKLPGREIVATREPDAHVAYEDLHLAVRDAFDAARRQIEDFVRIRRGDVKTHAAPETPTT